MSRVLFINLDEGATVDACLSENVGISAIESLPGGGTRLVCKSSEGAALMHLKFKSKLIKGDVTRERHRPASPLW